MRHLSAILIASFLTAAAHAAQEQKLTRQEERNAVCTAQADDRNMTGANRSAYMKQCLRGGTTKQIAAQQEKILACTGQAEEQSLVKRERRQFMTQCLRG
jgi:hypothetical protein